MFSYIYFISLVVRHVSGIQREPELSRLHAAFGGTKGFPRRPRSHGGL